MAHAAEALYAPRPQSDHHADGDDACARFPARCRFWPRTPATARRGQGRSTAPGCAGRRSAAHRWRCITSSATRWAARFNTPHAETHAILLPHTIGFNSVESAGSARPGLAKRLAARRASALFDFAASLGAPTRLRDFGLSESDLDRAAEIATKNPYWNPRAFNRENIRALLQDAWEGAATAAMKRTTSLGGETMTRLVTHGLTRRTLLKSAAATGLVAGASGLAMPAHRRRTRR